MGEVLQWAAVALTALVLVRVTGREFAAAVTLVACAMILFGAMEFLEPVTELLGKLRKMADLDGGALQILLKAAGIGLISQIAQLLCADGGETALGKVLEFGTSAVILWLGIPILEEILELLQGILDGA